MAESKWTVIDTEKPGDPIVEVPQETSQEPPKQAESQEQKTESVVEHQEAPPAREEKPQELDGIDTQGAQKRIRKLIAQRKAERERADKAEASARETQERLQKLEERLTDLSKGGKQQKRDQARAQYDAAQRAYLAAREKGDPQEELRAIQTMNNAQIAWDRMEREQAQPEVQPQRQEQRAPAQAEQPLPTRAQQWIEEQDWWEKDPVLRATAGAIATQLEAEGFSPEEDETYKELTSRLKKEAPHKFRQKPALQAQQTVAGASRTSSGRSTVQLDPIEAEGARRLGVDPVEFARQKLVAEQAKRENGMYGYMTVDTSRRK